MGYTHWYAKTHLSAEKAQTRAYARLSRPKKHSRGPQNGTPPQAKRKGAPLLIMLPKTHRLSALEVRAVLREGMRTRGDFSSARFVSAQKGGFAAVVPLRVARSAVGRNKARRALYAALREAPPPPVRAAILLERLPEGPLLPAFRAEVGVLFGRMRAILSKRT